MSVDKFQTGEVMRSSAEERERARRLQEISHELSGRTDILWAGQSHLTLNRLALSRILYYSQIYQQLIGVPGVIVEFGVQWGATMALLSNLRGIFEPYNFTRTIVGFDTFNGFIKVDLEDGQEPSVGDYAVPPSHADLLSEILVLHEQDSPVSHIQKYEIVEGDLAETFPAWLASNPQAIVGLAIFDVDLYSPTKLALEKVIPRLTRGSILVFDELNTKHFPGETLALMEVLGLSHLRLRQFAHQPRCAWAVWE